VCADESERQRAVLRHDEGRLLLNDVFNMSTTHPELMQDYSQHTFAGGRITLWIAPRGALLPVGVGTSISHWPLVAAALAVAAAPWFPWSNRFSVRTLLVATTLAAALMGLAVYALAN
jgi:hypothetical protein